MPIATRDPEAHAKESRITRALLDVAAGGLIVAMVVAYWLLRHAGHPGD